MYQARLRLFQSKSSLSILLFSTIQPRTRTLCLQRAFLSSADSIKPKSLSLRCTWRWIPISSRLYKHFGMRAPSVGPDDDARGPSHSHTTTASCIQREKDWFSRARTHTQHIHTQRWAWRLPTQGVAAIKAPGLRPPLIKGLPFHALFVVFAPERASRSSSRRVCFIPVASGLLNFGFAVAPRAQPTTQRKRERNFGPYSGRPSLSSSSSHIRSSQREREKARPESVETLPCSRRRPPPSSSANSF